jgi:magnesium-transporting ATPase (P-type)
MVDMSKSGHHMHSIKSIRESPNEELDKDIELIGVTGLEDVLQDRVAECINDFKEAQIKVWMLTGD